MADPDAVRLWQHNLCDSLGLKGRIIISRHGINGTVGGDLHAIKSYIRQTREYPAFKDIDFKWSQGTGNDFPRLRVRVRDEIVTFGVPDEIQVDEHGVIGGGVHLAPEEVNRLVAERGDNVVFFDGRNAYEARIGRFRDAVIPDVRTTPDFVDELESGKYDHLKNKAIVSYCTGGIRCEVLSVIMKNRGFKEVYQIQGGIVRYAEKYKNTGLWQGSLYVFDSRLTQDFSPDAEILGSCDHCGAPTNQFHNCTPSMCRTRILVCHDCAQDPSSLYCASCAVSAHN